MRKITFSVFCVFLLVFTMNAQPAYHFLENADGQHGIVLVGDVDNDGDLDLFIAGEQRPDPHEQRGGLYINVDGQGTFEKRDCPVTPGYLATASFGDINGDGYLDIIFSGHKNINIREENARGIALNDRTGNFTIADPALYPKFENVSYSACFADFNNDGLLDYMLASPDDRGFWDWESGGNVTYYGNWSLFFQQADGSFVEDSQQFSNYFRDQIVSTGDFDNDGDIDIFLQGYYPRTNPALSPFELTTNDWIAAIFLNDGTGQFTRSTTAELPSIGVGSHDWADLDGNGFLDLIIVGDGAYNGNNAWDAAPWYHRIFSNNNGVFTQIFESPRARQFSMQGANLLQDLDNDGDADVLLGGWADDIGRQKTFVYKNEDADGLLAFDDFVENTQLSDYYLPGLSEQDYQAADLNGDFILDYIYFGFKGGSTDDPPADVLDRAIGGWSPGVDDGTGAIKPYEKLSAPTALNALQESIDNEKVKVTFSWEAPANVGSKKSVTYNLAVQNLATGKWLYSPMSIIGGDKDGWRQVNKLGNVYLNKKWTLTLPKGNYRWSVQAIDAARFGGSFATWQTIGVGAGINDAKAFGVDIYSKNGNLSVHYATGEPMNIKVYAISGAKIIENNFKNDFSAQLSKGVYIVELNKGGESLRSKVIVK